MMADLKISSNADIDDEIKDDELSWPTDDIKRLLNRMAQHIPKQDRFRFHTTVEHLPWEQICFDNYSIDECYYTWKGVVKNIRKFRLLQEVIHDANEWLNHPYTKYKRSKNHHPDRPRRPPNTFVIFSRKRGPQIKNEFPTMGLKDVTKLLSAEYHNLSPKKMAKYVKKYKLSKQEYERKLEIFLRENPSEETSLETKRKKKIPEKITPFNVYFEDQVKKNPAAIGKTYSDMLPVIQNQWELLSDSTKLTWEERAEKKIAKQASVSDREDNKKLKKPITKKEQQIIHKTLGMPDKPPTSVYNMFTKMVLLSGKLSGDKISLQDVGHKWKNTTSEEKEELLKKHQLQQKEYQEKYATFLANLDPDVREEYELTLTKKKKPKGENEPPKKKKKKNVAEQEEETPTSESVVESTPTKKKKAKSSRSTDEKEYNVLPEESDIIKENSEPMKKKKKKTINVAEEEKEIPTYESVVESTPTKKKKTKSSRSTEEIDHTVLPEESDINVAESTPTKKKKSSRSTEENDYTVLPEKNDIINVAESTPTKKKKTKSSRSTEENDYTVLPEENDIINVAESTPTKKKKTKSSRSTEENDYTVLPEESDIINVAESTPTKKKKTKSSRSTEENDYTVLPEESDIIKENSEPTKKKKKKTINVVEEEKEIPTYERVEIKKNKKKASNQSEFTLSPSYSVEDTVDTPRSKKMHRKNSQVPKPKEPPSNAMEFYYEIIKETNGPIGVEQLTEAWNNLSKKDKKHYKKELEKTKKLYLAKYELFLESLPPSELLQNYL